MRNADDAEAGAATQDVLSRGARHLPAVIYGKYNFRQLQAARFHAMMLAAGDMQAMAAAAAWGQRLSQGRSQPMYYGERFNAITHLVGAVLALAGAVVLIVLAAMAGDPWKIVSASIYGATLVLLYTFSTFYHSFRGRAKEILQKLDHDSIYLLIAGSYTPFCLVTLRGAWGWSLFGVEWGLAVLGILQESLWKSGTRTRSLVIYVVMGWASLVALVELFHALGPGGFAWLVAGGLLYTIGIVFYVVDGRLRHAHGIWHLFVLAGSAAHYIAILRYVIY